MPFDKHSTSITEYIEDEIGVSIKEGNVKVLYKTSDTGLSISPTHNLISNIKKLFKIDCCVEKEDEYLWKNSLEYLKFMESNGY